MWAPIVHFAILATSLGNMNQTPKDILGSIDSVMTQSREPAAHALAEPVSRQHTAHGPPDDLFGPALEQALERFGPEAAGVA